MQLLKSQITSTKSQINSKSEISMTKKMYDIIRKSHKAHGESKPVWVIGAWNLDIVCYLLFDAWDFPHPRV
jgi:hypothetical protein